GILALYLFAGKYFGRDTGFWAALLLASSLILVVEAHLAKTDAALFGAVSAMQCALGDLYLAGRSGLKPWRFAPLLFWFGMAAAILLKGPIPLIMAAGTLLVLALWKRNEAGKGLLHRLGPQWGVPLVLLIVLPWFIAIYYATDGLFFSKAIGEDLLPKLVSGHESHGAPPGYYLLLAPLLFWPGSLLLLARLKTIWQRINRPGSVFLLAWLLPAWLLFELIPTKLPHYILPLLPALALLTADALTNYEKPPVPASSAKFGRYLLLGVQGLFGLLWLSVAIILALAPAILQWLTVGTLHPSSLVAIGAGIMVVAGAIRYLRQPRQKNLVVMLIGSCIVFGVVLMWALPGLELPWVAVKVRQQMDLHGPGKLVSVGYYEPSLVFLAGTETRLVGVETACESLNGDYRYLLLDSRSRDKFFAAAGPSCKQLRSLAEFPGYNYSKGKQATYYLFAKEQEPN
ncbi:MAG TPA: phospholipid carrier-dependent glycosyltransferase, partial [Geothermobacteraceae bacterium]|nr:phospholipid carrier-dependent glycosyltransferase [Geothermobacteraceae bacterium]